MSQTLQSGGQASQVTAEEARLARLLQDFRTNPPAVRRWIAPVTKKPLTLAASGGPAAIAPTGPKSPQALQDALVAREGARTTLKGSTDAIAAPVRQLPSGGNLLAALDEFRALPAETKNGKAAHDSVSKVVAQSSIWLQHVLGATLKPDQAAVSQVVQIRKAAMAELQKLTAIRQAVTTLATPEPDFASTGDWNKSGNVRIRNTRAMTGGPPDAGSAERDADSKRQIEKFLHTLEKEVSRSDAFAALVTDSVNAPGGTFDMFFGKGTAGAFDDYGNLGVDVDDLDSLPDDPRPVGGTKGGVTKGEIIAHVLEERMYGMQGGAGGKLAYIEAHQRCLSPGSYQNQHRRELGIPADSILYDNCQHSHTHDGCACFEALDTQGIKTIVHDIPTDLKANKPLATPGTGAPAEAATEVVQTFPGTAKQNVDAIIAGAVAKAKGDMYNQVKTRRSNPVADDFDWSKVEAQNLLHFITIAEENDPARIDARKIAIKREMDAYKASVEAKATLSPELEKAKARADQWRGLGTSPEEQFVAEQRRGRPAVINVGSSADGSTNCALCTVGAILNTTTADASKLVQAKLGKASQDATMQGTNLFLNAALKIDDASGPDARKAKLQSLPPAYLDEVTARYHLDKTSADYWRQLDEQIAGDFQFEGIRALLTAGVATRNAKGDPEYEVVQDGLPDEEANGGKMYPWAELLSRMEQYPDGTQYQVFVDGALQHWICADKVRGKVLFEDLQKNVKVTKEKSGSVVLPKTAAEAQANHKAIWDDEEEKYRTGNYLDSGDPLVEGQVKVVLGRVVRRVKESAPKSMEEFAVPGSAYVASATDKPHHPQRDEMDDAFQRGMFFAIAPKAAPKPAGAFQKTIGPAASALAGLTT